MSKRNPEPDFTEFNGSYFNNKTGEQFQLASDGSGKLIPTGYFFESVQHGTPGVANLDGPRNFIVRPSPWQWAKPDTAQRVMEMLAPLLPGVELDIQKGERNASFPYSHDQLEIRGKRGARRGRINAGLVASGIGRQVAVAANGDILHSPAGPLKDAANNMLQLLEEPKDE